MSKLRAKVDLVFAVCTQEDVNKLCSKLRRGKLASVNYAYNIWSNVDSIEIEYHTYKQAISAAHRYKKNPNIISVEVDPGVIKIK